GNTGRKATAAYRNVNGADGFGMLAHQFKPNRALAGNDIGVVEGMDEDITMPFGQAGGMGAGGVEAVAEQNHFTAQAPDGIDLDKGGCGGHDHDGADAQPRGRERHALGVIAGRGADDAAGAFLGRKMDDAIVRATNLEGEDRLEVL